MASLCQHCATLAHRKTASRARHPHSLPVAPSSLFTWPGRNWIESHPPSLHPPLLCSVVQISISKPIPYPPANHYLTPFFPPPSLNWGSPKNIKSLVHASKTSSAPGLQLQWMAFQGMKVRCQVFDWLRLYNLQWFWTGQIIIYSCAWSRSRRMKTSTVYEILVLGFSPTSVGHLSLDISCFVMYDCTI